MSPNLAPELRQNPFKDPRSGLWFWFDETGAPSGKGFIRQRDALRELLDYLDYLEDGPTLWQRIRAFFTA